ncbi:hypothetical protein DH2020_041449 [Rehmannia glutinosa]|uniref:Uncharacterized protein n=1 Tax=Rehmannia glutinosa TaxID=99300 RepID=A0ABR0URD3_REHGL
MDTTTITVPNGLWRDDAKPECNKRCKRNFDRVVGKDRVMTGHPQSPLLAIMHPPTPLMLPTRPTRRQDRVITASRRSDSERQRVGHRSGPSYLEKPYRVQTERFPRGGHRHEGDRLSATSVRSGRAYLPSAQLAINWCHPCWDTWCTTLISSARLGVRQEDMDMMEQPGAVAYMRTPLQAVPA